MKIGTRPGDAVATGTMSDPSDERLREIAFQFSDCTDDEITAMAKDAIAHRLLLKRIAALRDEWTKRADREYVGQDIVEDLDDLMRCDK